MIGIFDSGVGGLSVVRALMDLLPAHDLLYVGDTARSPYGIRSAETVQRFTADGVRFLRSQQARLIVLASHCASSVAGDRIRSSCDVPVLDVMTFTVDRVLRCSTGRRVGVIGAPTTVASRAYEQRFASAQPDFVVTSRPCPLIAALVEASWLKKPETRRVVKKCLQPLRIRQIDTLVWACSYLELLRPTVQSKIGRRVTVIDSAKATAEGVAAVVKQTAEGNPCRSAARQVRLCVTDLTTGWSELARLILKTDLRLEPVEL
jgi:glutamate racemase